MVECWTEVAQVDCWTGVPEANRRLIGGRESSKSKPSGSFPDAACAAPKGGGGVCVLLACWLLRLGRPSRPPGAPTILPPLPSWRPSLALSGPALRATGLLALPPPRRRTPSAPRALSPDGLSKNSDAFEMRFLVIKFIYLFDPCQRFNIFQTGLRIASVSTVEFQHLIA